MRQRSLIKSSISPLAAHQPLKALAAIFDHKIEDGIALIAPPVKIEVENASTTKKLDAIALSVHIFSLYFTSAL